MKVPSVRSAAPAVAAVVCLALSSFAQQAASSSTIGWVAGPSGAAVQRASVILTDPDRGVSNETVTEYGPAPNDQRHRFVFSGTARLPGGFRVSPIWTIASGVPVDILMPDGDSRTPLLAAMPADANSITGVS